MIFKFYAWGSYGWFLGGLMYGTHLYHFLWNPCGCCGCSYGSNCLPHTGVRSLHLPPTLSDSVLLNFTCQKNINNYLKHHFLYFLEFPPMHLVQETLPYFRQQTKILVTIVTFSNVLHKWQNRQKSWSVWTIMQEGYILKMQSKSANNKVVC